jgi:hypothetical protein
VNTLLDFRQCLFPRYHFFPKAMGGGGGNQSGEVPYGTGGAQKMREGVAKNGSRRVNKGTG